MANLSKKEASSSVHYKKKRCEYDMKLLYAAPKGEASPLPKEPAVKHFTISKYSELYEVRARSKIMIRVTFTILKNGDILFLIPFVKRQPRDTMQALDSSLKLLAQIKNGTGSVSEFVYKSEWSDL